MACKRAVAQTRWNTTARRTIDSGELLPEIKDAPFDRHTLVREEKALGALYGITAYNAKVLSYDPVSGYRRKRFGGLAKSNSICLGESADVDQIRAALRLRKTVNRYAD